MDNSGMLFQFSFKKIFVLIFLDVKNFTNINQIVK